jgi:opacity protein-like surface antigen
MKKLAFSIFCIVLGLAAHDAVAETANNFYVRVDGGGSFPTGSDLDHFDASGVVGAGVGFRFLPFFRTDVTVSYRPSYSGKTTDLGLLEQSEVKNLSGFVNAYFDLPTGTPFTPYIGAGIGAARNEVGTTTFTDGVDTLAIAGATRTSLAYQAMAGFSYPIFLGVALDVSYHYLNAGRFKTSTSATFDGLPVLGGVEAGSGKLRAHEVQVGLRVGF